MPVDETTGSWQPYLFPKQAEALRLCQPGSKNMILLSGPRLSGKCVTPDTLVSCADGIVPIGELASAGEGLFTPLNKHVVSMTQDGRAISQSVATHFYNSGLQNAITLKTSMGYQITGSEKHPLWSECNGVIGYRTTREIHELNQAGLKVWLPLTRQHFGDWPTDYLRIRFAWFPRQDRIMWRTSEKVQATKCKSVRETSQLSRVNYEATRRYMETPFVPKQLEIVLNEGLGYALGAFVGDGCYTQSVLGSHSMRFSSDDYEILAAVKSVLGAQFPDVRFKYAGKGVDYEVQSSSFRTFIAEIGMAGKYAHEKDIPSVILRSPKSVIIAFLQGLFDTDGTVCRLGAVTYCSTSEKLARQVQQLLLFVGIRSTRNFHRNKCRGAWIVHVRREDGFQDKVGFRLLRKQSRIANKKLWRISYSSYPPSLIPVLKNLHRTRRERGVGSLPRMVHKHIIDVVFRSNVSLSKKRIAPILDLLQCEHEPQIQQYLMDWKIFWDEVSDTSQASTHLVDISVADTHNFIGNSFINHNTWMWQHAICQHAWFTDRANICMLTITQSAAIDSGPWQHLTEIFIPDWISGNFGFDWVREPYVQNVTKKPACRVTNQWGNSSLITVESLRNEDEVEARFKGKAYSMIAVNELSKFKCRKTFDTLKLCLRMPHLTDEQHLFLADTNPDLDLGDKSWIYELWYLFRMADEDQLRLIVPDVDPKLLKPLQKRLRLIEFTVDDNLSMSEEKKAELLAGFQHNPDVVAAYYYGKWTAASVDAIFYRVFRPLFHIVPNPNDPVDRVDPEIMVPESGCSTLVTGWDPGPVNSAAVIAEKTIRIEMVQDKQGKVVGEREVPILKFLDEVVIIGTPHSLEELVIAFMEKMAFWEKMIGRPGNTLWKHWSDRSVFDMKSPESEKYFHQIIAEVSYRAIQEGIVSISSPIVLEAASRGPGSVSQRIDLFTKLLFDERAFFSKVRCHQLIQSIRSLKRGTNQVQIIAKGSPWKHAFDAASYLAASEMYDELSRMLMQNVLSTRKEGESTLVSVPI